MNDNSIDRPSDFALEDSELQSLRILVTSLFGVCLTASLLFVCIAAFAFKDFSLNPANYSETLACFFLLAVMIATFLLGLFLCLSKTYGRNLPDSASVASRNSVNAIISNLDVVIFSINKLGIMTHSEGQFNRTLGLKVEDRIGKSIFDLHRDNPDLLDSDRRVLLGEKNSVRTSMNDLWLEVHYSPVFDEQGQPNGATGVAFNVTDKVHSERALTETQDRLKAVLQHVPFSFWAIDNARKFIFREGIGLAAVGLTAAEMIGLSIDQIYRDFPLVLASMNRAFQGESFEELKEIGGRWYNIAFAPTRDADGKIVGISGITFDVTERKRIEDEKNALEVSEKAAVEASKLKSIFLANMSHEIRTPMNGVMGMMGLLAETELKPSQHEFIDAARASADTLLTVINDILDFSKVEAGKLPLEDIDFDLPHLLNSVKKTFSFQASNKAIGLVIELDPNLPRFVGGDPGRLNQILNNLLSNALKFTGSGSVCIKVLSEGLIAGKNRIRIEVIDTGIGISTDALPKLFHPFSQADASTTRQFGGTGLGLSISKLLVEKMSGSIGVESVENQGSKFWLTISLRTAVAPLVIKNEANRISSFKDIQTKPFRILVAEDNAINQKIAIKVLERMGLHVHVVANGLEALNALDSIPFDLVLMDCQMPELDGYEATRRIRSHPTLPRTKIPIVAMTANAITGDRERCLAAGMNDYISKPVKFDELYSVLSRWLINKSKAP